MYYTLLVVFIVIYEYRNVAALIEHYKSGVPFGGSEWGLLAITLIFIPVGIYAVKRMLQEEKKKKAAAAERAQNELDEAQRKRRELYLDDAENAAENDSEPSDEPAEPETDAEDAEVTDVEVAGAVDVTDAAESDETDGKKE